MQLVCTAIDAYIWVVIGSILLSYFVQGGRLPDDHPVYRLWKALTRLVDPVLIPIRQIVRPVRIGSAQLDLSPIILIVLAQLIQAFVLNCR